MNPFQEFAQLAERAARSAATIVEAAARGETRDALSKADGSLVTATDFASQRRIEEILRAATPGFGFYAEEEDLARRTRGDYTWIVDPLDGTHNFHFGFPLFAIQVALEHRGEIVAAAMALPMEGLVLHAWRGGGSYANGRRLRTSQRPIPDSLMLIEPRWAEADLAVVRHFREQVRGIRVISASCVSLAYLALGRADLLVDWDDKPWDLAAGTLLVEEAGGTVTDLEGGPFRVFDPKCLASNGQDHARFVAEIIASGAFAALPAAA